jgi:hypothetical protein
MGPSRFLELREGKSRRTALGREFLNEQNYIFSLPGLGFKFAQRPHFQQNRPRPTRLPQLWSFFHWLVVSPEVRDVLCRFDAAAVEYCELDWKFQDGTGLDGYGLVEIFRLLYAYDYPRCQVEVGLADSGRYIRHMDHPRVLRTNLPSDVHLFRDARWRGHIYVSRALAAALAPFAADDLQFEDPHDGARVALKTKKVKYTGAAAPPAIVHSLPPMTVPAELDVHRRMRLEIPPLLRAGKFVAAEEMLSEWMRALPPSPYHVIIEPDVQITTPAAEVADYLNGFIASQSELPKVLYAEMNAFIINPDRWFFDVFAFSFDGGREEEYDWLGDFYAEPESSLRITGLEKLQEVYSKWSEVGREHSSAGALAETLVIVRFQRLLQAALPLMIRKLPLLASAHDYDEYIVEIKA